MTPSNSHPAEHGAIALLAACLLVIVSVALFAAPDAFAVAPTATSAKPRVSLSVPGRVGTGRGLVVKGAVAPAPSRGLVRVEYRLGGKWRALGSAALRRGAFKVAAKLAAAVTSTRVHAVLIEGGRRVATSPSRTVRVRQPKKTPTPVSPIPNPPSPPPPSPSPPAPACPPTATPDPLSAGSLMESVRQYAALPNHLSSTPNSAAALDEFGCKLEAAGLTLGRQAFAYPEFVPRQVALTAGSTGVPAAAIAPLLYSGTTGPGGVTAELVDGTGGFTKAQAEGRIVVVSINYEHNSKAENLYPAIENAVVDEAVGLVAVTQVVGDYPKWEDVNARNGTGHLPVVTVGKHTGAAVIDAAKAHEERTLTLTASTGTACDRDVWGELEGAEPNRRVFIGTPVSSFTPSASEHGTGEAITIGLARHYAALPKSERPATLVFMALGGHEIGWLGLQALMASPEAGWFTGAEAYVHLGSGLGAPTAKEESDETIVTEEGTPDPTGRLHNSENPLLEPAIGNDWAAAGVPTANKPPHEASGGEQTYAYAAGIPTISFSGASLYFHTAGDLPSTVDPTILAEDADAFRRSVDTITALPPGALKAANGEAEELGAKVNAAERAPFNATLGAGGALGSGGIGGPAATPVASCP